MNNHSTERCYKLKKKGNGKTSAYYTKDQQQDNALQQQNESTTSVSNVNKQIKIYIDSGASVSIVDDLNLLSNVSYLESPRIINVGGTQLAKENSASITTTSEF